MRLPEIENNKSIDEYNIASSLVYTPVDFSNGKQIGQIGSYSLGTLQVWKITHNDILQYAIIDPKIGPTTPISYLAFVIGTNLLISKNAWTDPQYQRKGLSSELFMFVNKVEGHKIISDEDLTIEGERLWKSIIRSPKFNVKILYLPTSETFDINQIGQTQTSDGRQVISPTHDRNIGFYNQQTPNGQRFFFLIEMIENYRWYGDDGILYSTPRIDKKWNLMLESILQTYPHFTDGDP